MDYTKISATAFNNLALNAGVLLNAFTPANPSAPDSAILGCTTGGITLKVTNKFTDLGEDIDNCPKLTKELALLESTEVKASGNFAEITPALAKMLAGAADVASDKVTPRRDLQLSDFGDLWWVGDYGTNGGFVAVHLMNALSTGGLSISTSDKKKTKFGFELTAYTAIASQSTVPYEIYVHAGTSSSSGSASSGG